MIDRRAGLRMGISRLDVVVIVVIALIVLGLVGVGARHWWEKSNELECTLHLMTLGKSIYQFQLANEFLPPSHIARKYATWPVEIAAFFPAETATQLRRWNMELPYYSQPDEVRLDQLPYLYCPARRRPGMHSDPGCVPSDGIPDEKHYPGALGDYAACAGSQFDADTWEEGLGNGAMIVSKVLKKEGNRIEKWIGQIHMPRTANGDIPRGQSYTILLGEKHVPWGEFGKVSVGDGSIYNGDYRANFARVGGVGHPIAASPYAPFQYNFGSYHHNLCLFSMSDNSVRRMTPATDPEVLASLTKRDS